ncbi:methyltransferase domain-containing protein [Acidobacteriota bacterium]
MTSKVLLESHYNEKYSRNKCNELTSIQVKGYPKDRFEAAVYWGGEGDSLLEIGCGSGSVLLTLMDSYNRCVGVELSEVRANYLKSCFSDSKNVSIMVGNIEEENLGVKKESVDTILMNAVIEHLISPIRTLKYLAGFLKPGGRIVIITPNIAKWTRRIKLLLGYFPSTASLDEGLIMYDKKTKTDLYDEGHLHYFTFRSLNKILRERAGLSKVNCYGFGRPRILTQLFPKIFSDCLVIGIK